MRQALQVRCWKCQEVFTMSAEPQLDPPSLNLVDVQVACPYCGVANRVTVSADQVRIITVDRGGSGAAVDLSQSGALLDFVFDGQPPADS